MYISPSMINIVLPLMNNAKTRINTNTHNNPDAVFDVVLRPTDRGAAGYDPVATIPDLEHSLHHAFDDGRRGELHLRS